MNSMNSSHLFISNYWHLPKLEEMPSVAGKNNLDAIAIKSASHEVKIY